MLLKFTDQADLSDSKELLCPSVSCFVQTVGWVQGMRCRAGKDLSHETHSEACMCSFPTGGSTWLFCCQHTHSHSWNAELGFTLGCARTLLFVSPAQTISINWNHFACCLFDSLCTLPPASFQGLSAAWEVSVPVLSVWRVREGNRNGVNSDLSWVESPGQDLAQWWEQQALELNFLFSAGVECVAVFLITCCNYYS